MSTRRASATGDGNRQAVGIDVGGSSIKGAVVDVRTGALMGERVRMPAPEGFEPEAVIDAIAGLAERLRHEGPIGIGFPAIVKDGVLLTNPTSLEWPGWKGMGLGRELADQLGRPVSIANDADVAALAEQRFGAARGVMGTVVVLTLGTGIGSGVLRDGDLVPNVELGRIYLAGERDVAEEQCSARVRAQQDLSWEEYGARLQSYLSHLERIMAPDLIAIGGAISEEADRFMPMLSTRARLVAASLLGDAGVAGAAILADRRERGDHL